MLAARHAGEAAWRVLERHGIKVGIVALGGVLAAGTLTRTTFLPHTTVVQQLVARDSSVAAQPGALANAVSTVASAVPGAARAGLAAPASSPNGLDVNVDHAEIDSWVHRLSTSMSSSVEIALGRMAKYSDMIDQKLAAKQMPHDLIYLAMIESEFNPNARSRVQAVGLWQFMSSTARRFGLTVRGHVDERKDPARATDAAVAYLSTLYDEFGSWYLAAAAYNSGEGTVRRALKKVTGKSEGTDEDFFRILPHLPKETRDYVPKLIATARIGDDPAKYGITPRTPEQLASASVQAPHVTRSKPSVHRATTRHTTHRTATHRTKKHSSSKHRRR